MLQKLIVLLLTKLIFEVTRLEEVYVDSNKAGAKKCKQSQHSIDVSHNQPYTLDVLFDNVDAGTRLFFHDNLRTLGLHFSCGSEIIVKVNGS